MLDQEEINKRLSAFIAAYGIRTLKGLDRAHDAHDTPYVTLRNGLEIEQGCMSICLFREPGEAMWRHFEAELLYWLAGRNLIVWRLPPTLESDEVAEISSELANREAVMDNLEPPRLVQYRVTYYQIRCRLTAYKT